MTFEAVKGLATIYHHKFLVMQYLVPIIQDLVKRMEEHDKSKFSEEEFSGHVASGEEIHKHPYGTPEHEEVRKKYASHAAIHYKNNRHHPEHFANGVEDMTLVDLIELVVDWKAASLRNADGGSLATSMKIGAEKYNISPQLLKILENTVKEYRM